MDSEAPEGNMTKKQKVNKYVRSGEHGYLDLMETILLDGEHRSDRTGVGTTSIFAPSPLKFFQVGRAFPLMTTKKMAWKSILAETLWWAQGRYDLESLRADGCTWWDEWEKEDGTLGPVYGYSLRHFPKPDGTEFDQLQWIVNEIKTNPESRRLVATMWNPGVLDEVALPACHGALIQFYVSNINTLHLNVNIRSSDTFLGLPTNIAGYALFLRMVAQVTNLHAGDLTVYFGDAHVYSNHVNQVKEQISRSPYTFPEVEMDTTVRNIDDFKMEHFKLVGYNHHPSIKGKVAV